MKRFVFLFAVAAVAVSPIAAETVMVGLLNGEGVEFFAEDRTRLASALVEGAMEQFFEADHIVFDLGLPSDDETLLPDPSTAANIARSGGAGYFLDMRIGTPDEETGIPELITFEFIDLVAARVLVSGAIKRVDLRDEVADSITICERFGAKAASEALLLLK
jgi:hypothetical protein